jgi:long-chain acyl-CoA synthetase
VPKVDFRNRLEVIVGRDPTVTVAYELDGSAVSAADLLAQAIRVRSAVGERPGRVAVRAFNTVEALAAVHGIWHAGGSAVLISPMTPAAEVDWRIDVTGASMLVTPGAEPAVDRRGGHQVGVDAEAAIIFTSGTTGTAKAASIPFRAMEASARTIAAGLGLPRDGRALTDPPRSPQVVFVSLAHMGGLLATQTSWSAGKPILLVPKFEAGLAFDIVERFTVSALGLTPAMVFDLAHAPGHRRLATVRSVSVGTAPLPEKTRLAFEGRFGVPILRNYGQTEFTGAIAFERYDDVKAGRRPPMSVGRVAAGVEVRIVNGAGDDLAAGEAGEIWARGGSAMEGYLGDDAAPTAAGSAGGWIATGDLGTLDADGFLTVVGRLRDLLICGGFNVYPAVVEAAVNDLPGVRDSAVAAHADERLGEVPVVALVPQPGSTVDLEGLRSALRERLAPYELPRRLALVEAIPRTANGKVDRPAVAALFGPASTGAIPPGAGRTS